MVRGYLGSGAALELGAAGSHLRPARLMREFSKALCELREYGRTIPEIFQSKDKPLALDIRSAPAKRSIRQRLRDLILCAQMRLRPSRERSATCPSTQPWLSS